MNVSEYPSTTVRKAGVTDIPGILTILSQNLIANKKTQKPETLEKTGFLIYQFSADDAKSAIDDKDNFIFVVSTESDHVTGYAIGCDAKKLNSDFQEKLSAASDEIKDILSSKKTFYLRHIAKKIDSIGVGKELLRLLLTLTTQADYQYIICVIAEKPIQNKASKAFHKKNGFICVGFYQNEDHTFGVYLKKM